MSFCSMWWSHHHFCYHDFWHGLSVSLNKPVGDVKLFGWFGSNSKVLILQVLAARAGQVNGDKSLKTCIKSWLFGQIIFSDVFRRVWKSIISSFCTTLVSISVTSAGLFEKSWLFPRSRRFSKEKVPLLI